jgi:hypothetical protein
LVEYFKPKARDHIPEEFTKENVEGDREAQPAIKQVKMLKELI